MESSVESNSLCVVVRRLNPKDVLEVLNEGEHKEDLLKDLSVYHALVAALLSKPTDEANCDEREWRAATQIVYMLCVHGADVNVQDENGDTALLCYLREYRIVCDEMVVAFLRCGSDCCLKNKDGQDILQYILQTDILPKQIRARVLEYMPGIWRAVDCDDACTVRRLINQWCHVNVVKDGMSVLQLAYSKGTENIIRVISGIGPSMDLAHSVLAGDAVTVEKTLQANVHININLKNMVEMGATPLFYSLCNNNHAMIDVLLKHGARIDAVMQAENELELPLYFAALSHVPTIQTDILRHTMPRKPVPVDQMYYKGRNVIFYCIEHDVHVQLFEDILRTCSAHVLTQRIECNLDAREYAIQNQREQYVKIIDMVCTDWCSHNGNVANRNILCLHGYRFVLPLTTEDACLSDKWTEFMQLVQEFEEFKMRLRDATEAGDAVLVREMLNCKLWSDRDLDVRLADSRVCGDGQPLLHKSLLRGHNDVLTELAHDIVCKTNRKLDGCRDQYFRTALHYMYAMGSSKMLITSLEDFGMSEYAMDRDGRSPLAFKDRRGLQEMKDLVEYHLRQDFTEPEPDPWSVSLPMPITGYLRQCLHEHHRKKKREKAMYDGIDSARVTGSSSVNQNHGHCSFPCLHGPQAVTSSFTRSKSPNSEHSQDLRYSKHFSKFNQLQIQNGEDTTSSRDYFRQQFSNSEQSHVSGNTCGMTDQTQSLLKVREIADNTRLSITSKNVKGFKLDIHQESDFSASRYDEDQSDLSSEDGNLYEDYEGDQSDVESEEEQTSEDDNHCRLL